MAATFPIAQADLGDILPVQSVVWELTRQQELTGLGSGEALAADLAPSLWMGEVSLRPLLHTDARAMAARIDMLDGAIHAFYLANPLGWYPKMDPHSTIYGASAPVLATIAANRKEVAISGLPAGYKLSAGDMFAVDYGSPSRRGLYRLGADVAASGAGLTALVEVRPHLRPGVTEALSVTFARPAAKVKMVAGTVSQQMHSANRTRISFRVIQTLAAG
ncbi:MAG TPA: hypothetical protein VGN60_07520 [Devosia sp.]|jgi:hypothetical protein|nr:hypothetical protein [Devosia sp.]